MFARALADFAASMPSFSLFGLWFRPGLLDYGIFACLLWVYVGGPIALYRMPNASFNAKLRLVGADETLEPHALAFLDEIERTLHAAGFVDPQRITISTQSPLGGAEMLCENPATGDLANVVAMLNPRATTMSPLVTAVTFRSAFADGTLLQTTNTTHAGYWPDQPTHVTVVIPEVRDAVELYRLHRSRVMRKAATVAQTPLTRGTTPDERLAFATRQQLDTTNFMIERGYRKRSPTGVRLTVLGATFSAWRRFFPWKQIGERRRQRAAAEVVRLA
jgi:hypothetical protein